MSEAVFAGVGVFICAAVIWALSSRDRKQMKKNGIHKKFGEIPKSREWNDQVKNYYNIVSDGRGVSGHLREMKKRGRLWSGICMISERATPPTIFLPIWMW